MLKQSKTNSKKTLDTIVLLICALVAGFNLKAQDCEGDLPIEAYPCDLEIICGFDELDEYCLEMTDPGVPIYPFPNEPDRCALHNPNWFAFVAGADEVELILDISDCETQPPAYDGIQLMIYEGQPDCSSISADKGPSGLRALPEFSCNARYAGSTQHTLTFKTVPCRTYYVVVDGFNDDLCTVRVDVVKGLGTPQSPPPSDFSASKCGNFEDHPTIDTICLGASNVEFCASTAQDCAEFFIFDFVTFGNTYVGNLGDLCIEYEGVFDTEREIEICVYAANDCARSEPTCKKYYVAAPAIDYESVQICEGDSYVWNGRDLGLEEYEPGTYKFTEDRQEGTGDCSCLASYELTVEILNENDEAPIEVYHMMCGYDDFEYKGKIYQEYISDDPIVITGNVPICDSFYNVTVDVIGFEMLIGDPICSANGLTFPVEFFKFPNANIEKFDIEEQYIDYTWEERNSGDIVGNELELIITQEMLERYPNGEYLLRMEINHPSLEGGSCVFESTLYELNAEDYLPSIDIKGPREVCLNTIQEYTFDLMLSDKVNDAFITNVWSYSGEGVEFDNEYEKDVKVEFGSNATSGELCVEIETSCGFTVKECIEITIGALASFTVNPDDTICADSYTLVANTTEEGEWLLYDGPGVAEFDNSTAPTTNVTVDPLGVYTFVYTVGKDGCAVSDSAVITFSNPLSVEDVTYLCQNGNSEYVATLKIEGVGPFTVIIGGGTIDGAGTYTSEIIASGDVVEVEIRNEYGCSTGVIELKKLCDCDIHAGEMMKDTLTTCVDMSVMATHIDGTEVLEAGDVGEFILHDNGGVTLGTILAKDKTGTFSFQSGMVPGEIYYISYVVGEDDGTGSVNIDDACLGVSMGQPVIWYAYPTPDAGVDYSQCETSISLSATRDHSEGMWMYIGTGNVTIANLTRANTTATVPGPGAYGFVWEEDREGCVGSDTVEVTILSGVVLGNVIYECAPDKQSYRVKITYETSNAPVTEVNNKGMFTNDTLVSRWYDITEVDTLRLVDGNNCSPLEVTIKGDCECESLVGKMSTDSLVVCADSSCVNATYVPNGEFRDANDGGMYVLHEGSGFKLENVIDTSITGEFCIEDSTFLDGVYYISYVIGNKVGQYVDLNDSCLAVSVGQELRIYNVPKPKAIADFQVCENVFELVVTNCIGEGMWSVLSQPVGSAEVLIANEISSTTTAEVETVGEYCFVWTERNGNCKGSDTIFVTYVDIPIVLNGSVEIKCDDVAENYVISFEVAGGDVSSLVVDGNSGTLNGRVFTSDPIPSGDAYAFSIKDANACGETNYQGQHECPCLTEVGVLVSERMVACIDEDINVGYDDKDENLDPNDIREYILFDRNNTELLRQGNGTFAYDGSIMMADEEYIVRVYVGNQSGTGGVDLGGVCTQVSDAMTVKWISYAEVVIDAEQQELSCKVEEIVLDASGSKEYNEVMYEWTTMDGSIPSGTENNKQITVSESGTYVLKITTVEGGCTSKDSIEIVKSADIPNIVVADPEVLSCAVSEVTIDATGSSMGSEYDVEWTTVDGQIEGPTDGYSVRVSQPGTYVIRINNRMTDCDDTESIVVSVDRDIPTVEIQIPEMLTCGMEEVVITSDGSDRGGEYEYTWNTVDGRIEGDRNGETIMATKEGTYSLSIRNTETGCIDSSSVEVRRNDNELRDVDISLIGILCEAGDEVELVVVPNGGVSPYRFTLTPGETNTTGRFMSVGSGKYKLTVTDGNDCMIDTMITLDIPDLDSVGIEEDVIQVEAGEVVRLGVDVSDIRVSEIEWVHPYVDSLKCLTVDCDSVEITPSVTQTIHVYIRTETGCEIEDRVQLVVLKENEVFVPTGFTPNGDNINDYFVPYAGKNISKVNYMHVFTRWGEKLYEVGSFESGDITKGWNGVYQGQRMNSGVYAYQIQVEYLDGSTKTLKGIVNLLQETR